MPEFGSSRPSPSRSVPALVLLFSVVLSFAIGVTVGRGQGESSLLTNNSSYVGLKSGAPTLAEDVDFKQFWQVWNLMKDRFYKPLDDKSLYEGAVKGMVSGADDPYTLFMTPKEAKQFNDELDGAFEGIGAEVGMKNNQLEVISPLPNTPASRAGLAAGDVILAIDKTTTQGLTVDEAVSKIRGKEGTQVVLTIRHGKATPTDITMTREKITIDSVTWKMENGIATINISIFGPDSSPLFSKAVNDVLSKGAKGVVLDLRGDPGGLLTAAIDIASSWVGYQPVVLEKGPGVDQSYKGVSAPRLADVPTVVLVDGGSASASEIVSGALQDYGLAKLVGEKTFGKGSVQDLIDLPDGSAVKVTIAAWNTPKGRSINGTGITPDVVVSFTDKDIHDKRDVQKEKALEILRAAIAGK